MHNFVKSVALVRGFAVNKGDYRRMLYEEVVMYDDGGNRLFYEF